MIKCIKRIAGIGNFDSYDTTKTKLRKDFNNLNIIFGLNTYGKSTLCDVFKDINDDSTERIIKRKTIRCGKEYNSTDIKQNVVISTDCNTSTLSLTNNAWCNNNLKNRIYVFDTEFMYNNIFDGLSILDSYERKVNFTNYIIGEEGVKLAKKIEDNKKVLKLKNERIKELIPISQKDKNEKYILKYVQWKPNNTKAEIEARIIEKTSIFESKNKILNNNDRIIKYNDNNVTEYNEVKILKDKITQLNNILQRTYHIPSDIIGKIENHIANNMKNYVKAKAWLNTGYKNINQEIELCPFCGQALNKSDFYQTIKMYFDNSFQDYINEIASSIRSLEIKWDCTHLTEEIQKHRLLIHEEKGIFINSLDEIYDELTKLNEKVVKYEEELDKLLTDMEYNYSNFIDQKMSAPQISIDLLNHDLFTRLDDYQKYIDLFYSILDKKRKIITSMKQTLNSGTLEREIAALKIELRELNSQLCRYNEEELCKKWLDIYIEIQSIDKQIKEYETQLEESQNNYLNSYFGKISLLFSELGSKNYTIQRKKIPQRGYKPVYGIEVLFRNKPISNKMEKVFSESDRRALALSIFLTKILMLNENEKKNAIVVLDDPATSFDENRIKIINIKIKTIAQMVNQVFILAHHSSFTRDLYLSCKDKVNCYKINEIEAYNYGLYDMEPQEDLGTEYEKALIHIMKFNDRSVSDVSCNDLRIFMETYLDMVFAKQKIELNLDKLSLCDRINKYKELNLLSETAYKELHNYRELFNQESHELLGTNIESIRSVSISLISFLFNNITLNYS